MTTLESRAALQFVHVVMRQPVETRIHHKPPLRETPAVFSMMLVSWVGTEFVHLSAGLSRDLG